KNIILYIVIAVLLLVLIGGGIYLFVLKGNGPLSQCVDSCGDGTCQEVVCQGTGCPCAETKNNCSEDCADIQLKGDQVIVKWDEWLSNAYIWTLFDSSKLNAMQNKEKISNFFGELKTYKLGTIDEGKYAGKNLYRIESPCDGPCGVIAHIFVENNYKPILLTKYSDVPQQTCEDGSVICWGNYLSSITSDDKTEIVNLEPVSEIKIPDSNLTFFKETVGWIEKTLITQFSDVKKVFDFEGGAMYKTSDGCFIRKANDGTTRAYYFGFNFFKKDGENVKPDSAMGILDVKWSNGQQNTQEYRAGMYECYDYGYTGDINQLVEVGITGNGYKLYEPKDKNQSALKEMYDSYYPGFDAKTNQPKTKISYEEFLSMHPLVLWQDPFGNFIQLKDIRYAPLAERAKPVIYLYPKQETDVSVFVKPNGGFTFTDPEYKDGWKVKAKPNGEIYNYEDGKNYPYLFWEGPELNYKKPEQGFVVAKENVQKFLEEKLLQLGLIKKESDEFIEFWLPRMQDKEYYFISFMGKKEIDDGAPLSINPKPDTIIRVLMDYRGLDERINVKEQQIITPERKGFVVVEWGGVLHR
ncbi:MAG: hypothetical protein NT058_01005, partial [Candidatus Portnoybacteria bacterium]|nr:hypothetical protein [Candidatus Portnoybacteria bacterium]